MLAACDRGGETSSGSGDEGGSAPADTAVDSAPPASPVVMALDGEGIQLVIPESGSTRLVPFGAEAGRAISSVSAALGPARATGSNEECGAGPLDYSSWRGGLTVYSGNGQFVGWFAGPSEDGSEKPSTLAGIATGTSRSRLESVYTPEFRETSLGLEFSAADIYGVVSGDGVGAEVAALWAGTVCNFR